jgi:hypothetical protein
MWHGSNSRTLALQALCSIFSTAKKKRKKEKEVYLGNHQAKY